MRNNPATTFGVTYGSVALPAGSAASLMLGAPRDFGPWFQRQIWRWNFADGSPMTVAGGKMGATANAECVELEFSFLDELSADAKAWIHGAFDSREPIPGGPRSGSFAIAAGWGGLMAQLAPGSHFDERGKTYKTEIGNEEALANVRHLFGAASAVMNGEGFELVRPYRPWRPECASRPPAAQAAVVPRSARRVYFGVALPGLALDGGRQALAYFSALNYGGLITLLERADAPVPDKSTMHLWSYWDRSFVIGDLRWRSGNFGECEGPLLATLAHPNCLSWLVTRATNYHLRRTLGDARERVRQTAIRLLYGTELLEQLVEERRWQEVLESLSEPYAAVVSA